jgi:hypothetical protein
MGKMDHPNVGRIHSAKLDGPTPYLVQDLLTGGTLLEQIHAGSMDVTLAVKIAAKLARGLQHSHEKGVLHRDLKPENVLFNDRREPQLVDFGLAYISASAASRRLTNTGTVMGTPGYMAPEQAEGAGEVDARTDVYGLGAVLYAMLTGGPPFKGTSIYAVLTKVLKDPPVPPTKVRPDISKHVERICLKALAKAPGERYPDANGLAQDLDAFLAGERTAANPFVRWVAGAFVVAMVLGTLAVGVFSTPTSGLPAATPPRGETPSPDAPDETPSAPPPESRELTDREIEAGRGTLKALENTATGKHTLQLADKWLKDYPTHPDRSRAEEFRAELQLRVPLREWKVNEDAEGVFLSDRRLLVWRRNTRNSTLRVCDLANRKLGPLGDEFAIRERLGSLVVTPKQIWLGELGGNADANEASLWTFNHQGHLEQSTQTGLWRISTLAASKGGGRLAVGGRRKQGGGRVELRSLGGDPNAKRSVNIDWGFVTDLFFSPDDRHLVAFLSPVRDKSGSERQIRIFDATSLEQVGLRVLREHPITGCFLTSTRFVAGSPEGTVFVFDTVLSKFETTPFKDPKTTFGGAMAGSIRGMLTSPDRSWLYTAFGSRKKNAGGIAVWNAQSHELLRRVDDLPAIRGLSISPSGEHLSVTTYDPPTLQLWRARR